jgi:hypothetical protein
MTKHSHFTNSRFLFDVVYNGPVIAELLLVPHIQYTEEWVVLREMTTRDNKTGHFEAATATTTTPYCFTVTAASGVPKRRPAGMKGSWEYIA